MLRNSILPEHQAVAKRLMLQAMEGNQTWWFGRTSNPVGAASLSRVGSTPIPFRHMFQITGSMTEHATDFDEWLAKCMADSEGFTMLVVLIGMEHSGVKLLRSAYLHVIGDELDWPTLAAHLDGARVEWDAVALFRAGVEGLIADDIAKKRLDSLVKALQGDRTIIRDGEFLNRNGLRLRLDDA